MTKIWNGLWRCSVSLLHNQYTMPQIVRPLIMPYCSKGHTSPSDVVTPIPTAIPAFPKSLYAIYVQDARSRGTNNSVPRNVTHIHNILIRNYDRL